MASVDSTAIDQHQDRATVKASQDDQRAAPQARRLDDLLVERGLVSRRDVNQAAALQAEVGGQLGPSLVRIGAITEEDLLSVLSEQLEMPIADPLHMPLEIAAYREGAERLDLPPAWFDNRRTFAWFDHLTDSPDTEGQPVTGLRLNVLAENPLDPGMRETIEAIIAADDDDPPILDLRYHLATSQTIDMCLSRLRQRDDNDFGDDRLTDATRLREMAEEAPVIDFVNNVFAVALKENASDIHIEAFEHHFVVRYRIDGVLHTRQNQSRAQFDAIASRIKLIAGMDIAERRLPQDGRHTIRFAGNDIDLRVSSVPSTWGESLVLRLLRKQTELPDLEGLGLMGRSGRLLDEILKVPNGVFLVTGPTGSGKSTTLYRGLEKINDGYRKIITIEDPVEYDIEGITQIQVKPDIGYNFASGLRAILRQDPDVIMVGEIRDGETATIAAQASLTGHFVLSTLHTNSSLAAITRLEDIGLERFLISASVRGLMAQRLVRRLCSKCSRPAESTEGKAAIEQAIKAGAPLGDQLTGPEKWLEPVGCEACDDTGYRGRIAVFEIAKIDDPLREAIIDGRSQAQLFAIARKEGFLTLFEDGLIKARAGLTTLGEIHRVCGGETG